MELIELDGSVGEGGGQILRSSLALALLTGRGFHLRHIRAGRSKPGLQPQHLACVKAAAAIGQAAMRGASKGSSDLDFRPGKVIPGNYHFAIGTAGAASLVLHTVYLPLALADAPSHVTIDGGTHVPHSPCFHFLETTWLGYMKLLGLGLSVHMRRPGFYPRGGGLLEADILVGQALAGLRLAEVGQPAVVKGVSAVAGLPSAIARRQAERAGKRLRDLGLRSDIREQSWSGGPGTVLTAALDTLPVPTLFFGLGALGKPAERVADEASNEVKDFLRAAESAPLGVDAHSADQLLLPLCFASGPSSFPVARISSHLTTNAEVIRAFLDREIDIRGQPEQPGWVHIA